MTLQPSKTLFEKQVELTRTLIALHNTMDRHLASQVMPHLDSRAKDIVQDLVEHLWEENAAHPDLLVYLDTSIVEIRKAIEAGKTIEQVAIPRERLIGCSEASDTQTSYTLAAEALQAALPPLERLQKAAREAQEHAEAIRLSLDLFHME